MGFSVGLRRWSDLDAGIVAAVRAFATAHGKRPDAALDETWWQTTLAASPAPSRHGLQDRYGSATSYALEAVLDRALGLARWKARHPGAEQWLMFPPFMFAGSFDGEPPFWTKLTADPYAIMVGDPVVLLDHWDGVYADEAGVAYDAAGRAAFEGLDRCAVGDDDGRAYRGVEYAMYYLLNEAWEQRVPVVVYW